MASLRGRLSVAVGCGETDFACQIAAGVPDRHAEGDPDRSGSAGNVGASPPRPGLYGVRSSVTTPSGLKTLVA